MPQIYLFIFSALATAFIVARRNIIVSHLKKVKFKNEVAARVDELQKERQKMHQERFKETYLNERKNKRYDFSEYKITLRKADVAMAKEQWNEAKKYLIQSMSLTKDETSVSLKLAQVYLESGDLKRAEEIYLRLSEADPKNHTIHESLARIYTKKKRYKEAVSAYVKAIELDPNDDKKLVGLGQIYHLLMRHSLAGECFRRAAELRPREVSYLFILADACRKDEDYENALFTYEKILTLEPYNEKARSEAQDVRIRMNEIEKIMSN